MQALVDRGSLRRDCRAVGQDTLRAVPVSTSCRSPDRRTWGLPNGMKLADPLGV
jgi:hypothetical protein